MTSIKVESVAQAVHGQFEVVFKEISSNKRSVCFVRNSTLKTLEDGDEISFDDQMLRLKCDVEMRMFMTNNLLSGLYIAGHKQMLMFGYSTYILEA